MASRTRVLFTPIKTCVMPGLASSFNVTVNISPSRSGCGTLGKKATTGGCGGGTVARGGKLKPPPCCGCDAGGSVATFTVGGTSCTDVALVKVDGSGGDGELNGPLFGGGAADEAVAGGIAGGSKGGAAVGFTVEINVIVRDFVAVDETTGGADCGC